MGGKRLTIEYIAKQFEKEDYELLGKEYVNNKQKLEYICPNGHRHSICWSDWQQGRRCGYCAARYYTIEDIRKSFVDEGYVLLTKKYINCEQKLEYICSKGHRHNISWSAWKNQGQRCLFCAGLAKLKIEFIRSEFEKEGYILLATKYKNAYQKLKYVCPKGHKHSISWTNWRSGYRCYYCFGNVGPTVEFVKKEAAKENYEMVSDSYVNNRQLLEYICPIGHRYKASWDSWQQGKRCWKCYCIRASLNKLGNKNWNWKGGIACEPYCDAWADKEYKESIKERDNHECQNPDCWGISKRLTIHHIDYVKKHCDPGNLITLCNSCNIRANKDREWHTSYYKEIVRRRNLANEI